MQNTKIQISLRWLQLLATLVATLGFFLPGREDPNFGAFTAFQTGGAYALLVVLGFAVVSGIDAWNKFPSVRKIAAAAVALASLPLPMSRFSQGGHYDASFLLGLLFWPLPFFFLRRGSVSTQLWLILGAVFLAMFHYVSAQGIGEPVVHVGYYLGLWGSLGVAAVAMLQIPEKISK